MSNLLIVTSTFYFIGEENELLESDNFFHLDKASLVQDTGTKDIAEFISSGATHHTISNYVGSTSIGKGQIVAMWPWEHALPVGDSK